MRVAVRSCHNGSMSSSWRVAACMLGPLLACACSDSPPEPGPSADSGVPDAAPIADSAADATSPADASTDSRAGDTVSPPTDASSDVRAGDAALPPPDALTDARRADSMSPPGDAASADARLADGASPDTGGTVDGTTGNDGATGDVYIPWEGGPAYWAKWPHSLPSDPNFFPVAVFWQSAVNADNFAAIGINTYIGAFDDAALTELDQKSMYVVTDQGGVTWRNWLANAKLAGWAQGDEPDNAQPKAGGGYGPCIDPVQIQSIYTTYRTNDPSRPVFLNLGRGVAATNWVGRGSCSGRTEMYPEYAKGTDVLSFDIYPVNSTDEAKNNLYYVADGVERLRQSVSSQKATYAYIETTDISSAGTIPSPAQIKAEVWMSLVHGGRIVAYFSHIFAADGAYLHDDGLLRTASSKTAVQAIDAQVASLAPVLNTQSLANGAAVASSAAATPIDIMVKRHQGALYIFAVAARSGATQGTFTLRGVGAAAAEVIGESRSITVANGTFSDDFAADYAVHLYRVE